MGNAVVLSAEVTEAKNHPNADVLRIYEVSAPGWKPIQVIANMETVYEPGDRVAVARIGVELKDGTRIKRATLRGVDSYGMLLGKVNAELGMDLTPAYAVVQSKLKKSKDLIKWTSINSFHKMYQESNIEQSGDYRPPIVMYRAKVKLHGTNAAVRFNPDGEIWAQSRNRVLNTEHDNMGWCAFVEANKAHFERIRGSISTEQPVMIFGEWCGGGIASGVAITDVEKKIFAVFAIQIGDPHKEEAFMITDPATIRLIVEGDRIPFSDSITHDQIFILPWLQINGFIWERVVDLAKRDAVQVFLDDVNKLTYEVEKEDPWVSGTFGIKGTGEGIVIYPISRMEVCPDGDIFFSEQNATFFDRPTMKFKRSPSMLGDCLFGYRKITELMFKAKGEKHKNVKKGNPAQIDPEEAKNAMEFIDLVVTDARMEQGFVEACNSEPLMNHMRAFIQWMSEDLKKECQAELDASGLTWKMVHKRMATKLRKFLEAKEQKI